MPEISRFYGIKIGMYYGDHNPPHFHASYEHTKGIFTINDLKLIEGNLPKRVVLMIIEWAFEHREELLENWHLSEKDLPLIKIKPLE